MNRTLTLLTSIAVLALTGGSAMAKDITINIVGKDMPTLQQEFTRAAERVCRDELRGSLGAFQMQACVKGSVADATAKVAQARAGYASARSKPDLTVVSASK
jgi:hypothetical protein